MRDYLICKVVCSVASNVFATRSKPVLQQRNWSTPLHICVVRCNCGLLCRAVALDGLKALCCVDVSQKAGAFGTFETLDLSAPALNNVAHKKR
jgi:hypothetical protein